MIPATAFNTQFQSIESWHRQWVPSTVKYVNIKFYEPNKFHLLWDRVDHTKGEVYWGSSIVSKFHIHSTGFQLIWRIFRWRFSTVDFRWKLFPLLKYNICARAYKIDGRRHRIFAARKSKSFPAYRFVAQNSALCWCSVAGENKMFKMLIWSKCKFEN